MVAAKIAHIHIERHGFFLGPGVYADVRFGQQHGRGHAARPVFRGRKGMKQLAHRLQPGGLHGSDAPRAQRVGIGQPRGRAAAVVKIGSEVKALHDPDFRRCHNNAWQRVAKEDA